MNGYYLANVFITVAAMITMVIHLGENETLSRRVKDELRKISIMILIGSLCELTGNLLEGADPSLRMAHSLVKAIEFTIAPTIPILFIKIVAHREIRGKIKLICEIIAIVNFSIEAISVFIPFIFYVDESNRYTHGDFYIIYNLMYIGGIAAFLLMLKKNVKKYQNRNKITISTLIVFLVSGLSIRLIDASIYTDWVVVAITYIMFIIYYSDLSLKVDALTDLLNRKSYEHRLKKLDYASAIIFIDANDFKSVNDQYGHQCGDNILRIIAKSILAVYGKYGYAYRIGGDEFCIITKQGVIEEYAMAHPNEKFENLLRDLSEQLDSCLKEQCKEYPMLRNGVSKGWAMYNGLYDVDKKDNESNHYTLCSVKEVVRMADARMYEDKKIHKKNKETK